MMRENGGLFEPPNFAEIFRGAVAPPKTGVV